MTPAAGRGQAHAVRGSRAGGWRHPSPRSDRVLARAARAQKKAAPCPCTGTAQRQLGIVRATEEALPPSISGRTSVKLRRFYLEQGITRIRTRHHKETGAPKPRPL